MPTFATDVRRGARAGQLRHRLGFFKRQDVDDGMGNTKSAFPGDPEFEVSGKVVARLGGETVLQARLQDQQLYLITVRQNSLTRNVTAEWMAKDMNDGKIFAIKSGPVDPDDSRAFFEFLAQTGVAP